MSSRIENSWDKFFVSDFEKMKNETNEKNAVLPEISTFYFPKTNIISLDEISISDNEEEKSDELSEKPQTLSSAASESQKNEEKIEDTDNSKIGKDLQTTDGKSTTEIHSDSQLLVFLSDNPQNCTEKIVETNEILGKKTKKTNFFQIDYSKSSHFFTPAQDDCYSSKIFTKVLNQLNENENENEKADKNDRRRSKILSIRRRKENADNIRKRIKAAFLKSLKHTLNEKLKSFGAKKLFTFLPQTFVSDISRKVNNIVLNLSLENILSKNFCKGNVKGPNFDKYLHNCSVLDYLNRNKSICEKSGFEEYKKMNFSQLYQDYFHSREFQLEILKLKGNNENEKYIMKYIEKAWNFLSFYENYESA